MLPGELLADWLDGLEQADRVVLEVVEVARVRDVLLIRLEDFILAHLPCFSVLLLLFTIDKFA